MNKQTKFYLAMPLVLAVVVFIVVKARWKTGDEELSTEITPRIGSIRQVVSTTGTVLPKNRLSIKPPVNGRIESILVKEGEEVKAGQILAWMSSTERAALLDAARGQGGDKIGYWQEVYKPIALFAPINGEVIVATTQPGQTVTTADAVVVLSDRLIVRAQVDETDIGKIKLKQDAVVSLDAYPDTKIKAVVEHIYYESKTLNNVTIYEVDLLTEAAPDFFRSGMNTSIDFIVDDRSGILLLPLEAVLKDKGESFVLVAGKNGGQAERRMVRLGIADDKNTEIISGLAPGEKVVVKSKKYALPKTRAGANPFMPQRRERGAAGR